MIPLMPIGHAVAALSGREGPAPRTPRNIFAKKKANLTKIVFASFEISRGGARKRGGAEPQTRVTASWALS